MEKDEQPQNEGTPVTDSTTQQEQQDSHSQPPTPQTPPQNQPTNNDTTQLFQLMLERERADNERLRREITAQQQTPPPVDRDALKQQYFDDPVAAMEQTVKRVMEPMLQPFGQFIQQQRQVSEYDRLKGEFRQTQFGSQLTPEIESAVDQMMAKSEPTIANLQAAFFATLGMKQMGLIRPSEPAQAQPGQLNLHLVPNTPPAPTNDMTPPHLRSSPPAAPRAQLANAAPKREYTENELRMMRTNNITPEEFDEMQKAAPSELESVYAKIKQRRTGGAQK